MRARRAICYVVLTLTVVAAHRGEAGEAAVTLMSFTTTVPEEAPSKDVWTTLICHFDKPGSFDADVASAKPEAGGCFDACKLGQPGKFGKSVLVEPEWGLLMYYGAANVSTLMGTADFWIKSAAGKNIWADGRNHYLLGIHCANDWIAPELLLVKTERDTLQLGYIASYTSGYPELPQIEIATADIKGDRWHHILVSWDTRTDRLWLAVDGKGQSVKVTPHVPPGEVRALYLGGKRYAYHLRETAGAFIDELRVTCRSVGWSEQHPHKSIEKETGLTDEQLVEMTHYARSRMLRHADSQRFGGWGGSAWPRRGKKGEYWARSWTPAGSIVNPGKAHVGTTLHAAHFLILYEALREQWLYDVPAKTGEMLLLTQSEEGWWRSWSWKVTPAGLEYDLPPRGPKTNWIYDLVNLDDLTQARPMFLLCWLYRLSGERRFLDGAIRSADFVLKTQNPNGGWGHFWNIEAQRTMGSSGSRWEASEFEDFAFLGAFYQMLVAYRFTGEQKYLNAALRGADWVVEAQLNGATRGWAEQYDAENVPAWGRDFEPPSCGMMVAIDACEGLRAAFLITGEVKYLKPIEDCVRWARGTPHRDGNMFYWTYDVATGRPIAAVNRERVFFMDSPDDLVAYRKATAVTKRGEKVKEFDFEYWGRVVEQGRAGTLKPDCAFATLDNVAAFLNGRTDNPMRGVGANLRAAALLKGELEFRPTLCDFTGNWRDWPFWAYPHSDLYEEKLPAAP